MRSIKEKEQNNPPDTENDQYPGDFAWQGLY